MSENKKETNNWLGEFTKNVIEDVTTKFSSPSVRESLEIDPKLNQQISLISAQCEGIQERITELNNKFDTLYSQNEEILRLLRGKDA